MNYVFIFLISILCLLIIKNLLITNSNKKFEMENKIMDNTMRTIYDNKPLNLQPSKRRNQKVDNNCRTTIVECDEDSDCLNACAGGDSQCINGFCAYVYEKDNTFCQNGGIPVSYFHAGYFNYAGCICPPAFIGRFCDIPNNVLPATI